jgi:hypothetical protein
MPGLHADYNRVVRQRLRLAYSDGDGYTNGHEYSNADRNSYRNANGNSNSNGNANGDDQTYAYAAG